MNQSNILINAAGILQERGKTQGTCIHLASGKVDLWGALCLAGGAKENKLEDDIENIGNYVPQANIAPILMAYSLIEAFVGKEPGEWSDEVEVDVVIQLLQHLGYQVKFAFSDVD